MLDLALDAIAAATGCDRSALGHAVGAVPESTGLSEERLLDRIAAQERAVDALQAWQAHDLAAFGAAMAPEDLESSHEPSPHAAAGLDVADALNLAVLTGQNRIHAADAAVGHPELLGLVGTGSVSMVGLRRVCAATDVLEPEQRLVVDRRLAGDAVRSELTPGQLEKAALRRVLDVDPAAADNRAEKARKKRYVRLSQPVDGTAGIFARLRAEEALALFGRLDRTARGMRGDGDERSLDELMADLLVELVTGTAMQRTDQPVGSWANLDGFEPWLWSQPPPLHPVDDPSPDDSAWDTYLDFTTDHGPDQQASASDRAEPDGSVTNDHDRSRLPGAADGMREHPAHAPPPCESAAGSRWRVPMRVEVQVVISAATLLGLDNAPGLLRGYGAVPAWVLHDLVDNAAAATEARTTLRGLFCDPVDGRLVAMDSTTRCFSGGLRKFALYRDQHCRLSGGRIVDVDHIAEHRSGGKTSATNAQALGKLAHVLKDHPAITVTPLTSIQLGDGLDHLRANAPDVEWKLPTGRTRLSEPPPALGPGSRPERSNYPISPMERHLAAFIEKSLDAGADDRLEGGDG